LDQMTHRGPFQPRTFCDSVKAGAVWARAQPALGGCRGPVSPVEVGGKHFTFKYFLVFLNLHYHFSSPWAQGCLLWATGWTCPASPAGLGHRARALPENPNLSQMFWLSLQLHAIWRRSGGCKNPRAPGCELPAPSLLQVWPASGFFFLKLASK